MIILFDDFSGLVKIIVFLFMMIIVVFWLVNLMV